jgi:serine/threonine protein kinase
LRSLLNSFSIIMWEMLTGQQAWVTLDYKQMVAAVLRDRKRPPVPPDTNKDCKDLLDQCWAQDPNDRPTFSAIVVALQAFKLLSSFPSLNAPPLMLFTRDILCMYGCKARCSKEADADRTERNTQEMGAPKPARQSKSTPFKNVELVGLCPPAPLRASSTA